MLALARDLYHHCYGSPTYNICILGIQQTGKTVTNPITLDPFWDHQR